MDRTSRIGIFVCLAAMVYLAFYGESKPVHKPAPVSPAVVAPALSTSAALATNSTAAVAPPAHAAPAAEELAYLENGSVKVTLTSLGASIRQIELKKARQGHGNVVLNEQAHSAVLQLAGWPGAEGLGFKPGGTTPGTPSVSYAATLPDGLQWTRTLTLGTDFVVTARDLLTNPGPADVPLPAYSLSVGQAQPLKVGVQYQAATLGIGWLTRDHFHLTTIGDFNPGFVPLLGIRTHAEKDAFDSKLLDNAPLRWLGAENQFFTVLLTPTADHLIDHAEFQCLNQRDPGSRVAPFPPGADPEIEAAAWFPGFTVPAGRSVTTTYTVYAGPKDFDRLNALGEQQGELMNYGKFELLIVPMLATLHFFHSFLGNYGVAIILLTLCIKGLTWPLQSIANRSGKRMQAVAPKLKELQAKYKETPEKLNTETFALYKEYGVNPFGGCIPALIQMPVFFSLYFMLQNAGELRGQSFLWVRDLTQSDTVFSLALPFVVPFFGISHFILNPLPIMVTGLTMVMMRMTPQMGDPQQQKVAQFMPLIFLVFLYNFAAALSLYYVINNCVSIFQIYRNLRKPLPELKRVAKKK